MEELVKMMLMSFPSSVRQVACVILPGGPYGRVLRVRRSLLKLDGAIFGLKGRLVGAVELGD